MNTIFYYAKDLKKWDLIAVAEQSCMYIGFYAGRGKTGTIQYYSFWTIERFINKSCSEKDFYKSYVNSDHRNRIIKVTHPELILTQEYSERYKECKKVLVTNNLIEL